METHREHVVGFVVPSRPCGACWTALDVVTLDTSTIEARSHGIIARVRSCYGCGDEVNRSTVVAMAGRCAGCSWRGPLAEIAFRDLETSSDPHRQLDGVSAPLCLLCRDGFRTALRGMGWRYEMRALEAA